MQRYLILLGLLFVTPITVFAVCQETDGHGNASFVDCNNAKTENAVPVEIKPINTAESKGFTPNTSTRSTRKSQSAASQKKQAYTNNHKELEAARKALEEAKEVREGDRQKTISGSKLTEQYFSRVAAAENRVKKAEQNLK